MATLQAGIVSEPRENPPGRNFERVGPAEEKACQGSASTCDGTNFLSLPRPALTMATNQQRAYGELRSWKAPADFTGAFYDVVPENHQEQFPGPARKEHFQLAAVSAIRKGGIVALLFAIRALKELRRGDGGKRNALMA